MPKFLKYMFNFLVVIMALFLISGIWVLIFPFLIYFLCNGLLRIPLMLVELTVLRPYLVGEHIKKTFFKINIYAWFSVMPLWLMTLIFQELCATSIKGQMPIFWVHCIGIIMAVLIGFCEVYIQTDFIKKRNLATNLSEVVKRLRYIVIPFWILFYIVISMLLPLVLDKLYFSNEVNVGSINEVNAEYITFK